MLPDTELEQKRQAREARKRAKQEDPACERHCQRCWAPRDKADRKLCAKCRAYSKHYQAARIAQRKEQGVCIQCGKVPALYLRSSCSDCLTKNAMRTRRYLGCKERVTC